MFVGTREAFVESKVVYLPDYSNGIVSHYFHKSIDFIFHFLPIRLLEKRVGRFHIVTFETSSCPLYYLRRSSQRAEFKCLMEDQSGQLSFGVVAEHVPGCEPEIWRRDRRKTFGRCISLTLLRHTFTAFKYISRCSKYLPTKYRSEFNWHKRAILYAQSAAAFFLEAWVNVIASAESRSHRIAGTFKLVWFSRCCK